MDEKLSMGIKERTRGKISAMVVEGQITKSNRNIPRPKTNILVRELLDGAIKLIWNNKELDFLEITKEYLKEVKLSSSA